MSDSTKGGALGLEIIANGDIQDKIIESILLTETVERKKFKRREFDTTSLLWPFRFLLQLQMSYDFSDHEQVTLALIKYEIALFPIFRKDFWRLAKTSNALYSKIKLITPPGNCFGSCFTGELS